MAKRRLRIAVDLDNMVANLAKRWLELYNAEHGTNATGSALKSWDMHKNFDIGHKIYRYLDTPGLYLELEPLAGAVEGVRRLNEMGEVHVISAPSKEAQTAADKLTWCQATLPFLKRQQITLSHHKHLFAVDVFLDDAPQNIRDHAEAQPRATRLAIAWPYNYEVRGLLHLRAENYLDTERAWGEMLTYVEGLRTE